jgi:predicted MPP superfamily phosphohydrolase
MTTKTTILVLENTGLSRDYRFVFVSDFHAQALRHTSYVQKIVNKIQNLEPDFVLIG